MLATLLNKSAKRKIELLLEWIINMAKKLKVKAVESVATISID